MDGADLTLVIVVVIISIVVIVLLLILGVLRFALPLDRSLRLGRLLALRLVILAFRVGIRPGGEANLVILLDQERRVGLDTIEYLELGILRGLPVTLQQTTSICST